MTSSRVGLVALALFVVPAVAPAQTNRVEKTVPYRLDASTKVDAKVGPVMIDNVKITNMGRGFGRGGFGPKGMQPSEGSTTLRFAFDVNNPGEDWEITFTLEFYDKAGKLIDRSPEAELGGEGGGLALRSSDPRIRAADGLGREDLDERPPRLTPSR